MKQFKAAEPVQHCRVCQSRSLYRLLSRDYQWPTRDDLFEMKHDDRLCLSCGFVFSQTVPQDSYLTAYYQNAFFFETSGDVLQCDYDASRRLQFLKQFIPSGSKILEIGANNGLFCRTMNEAGFQAHGVDLLDDGANKPSMESERTDSFDAIVTYYMFEHLIDTDDFLAKLKSKMHEQSVVVIEVPDFEEHPSESVNHEHFIHLTPYHLAKLMERSGFKTLGISRELKSRYFGFVAAFALPTHPIKGISIEEYGQTAEYFLEKYLDMVRLNAKKALNYHAAIAECVRIAETKNAEIVVWGMNDHATEIGNLLKMRDINPVPVDNNTQKQGRLHPGYRQSTISSAKAFEEKGAKVFLIAASAAKRAIEKQILESGYSDYLVVEEM